MKPKPDSRIQIAALVFLCVSVGGYQLRNSADLYYYLTDSAASPRYPIGVSTRDLRIWGGRGSSFEDTGLRRGDLLIEIDGRAVRGLTDVQEPLADKRAGDSVRVAVLRDGKRIEADLKLEEAGTPGAGRRPSSAMRTFQSKGPPRPPAQKQASPTNEPPRRRPNPLSSGETTLLIFSGFLTIWFCFALGFFVAFRRPKDILAWEMLGLLLGFGQMAAGEAGSMYGWGVLWSVPGAAYVNFISSAWPAFLLWFGLDFPDPASPKRFLSWMRWPITIGILAIALPKSIGAAGAAVDVSAFASVNQWSESLSGWFVWVAAAAISLFFANLGYKRGTMTDPDSRRRLRLLFAGGSVSWFQFLPWCWRRASSATAVLFNGLPGRGSRRC